MTEVIPLNEKALHIAIGRLFASFPVHARKGVRIEAYVAALSKIPTSFVQEACEMASMGRVGDGSSIPAAAELAYLARQLHVKTLKPNRIHDNYVIVDREQRKRVIDGFRSLLRDLRSGKTIDPDLSTANVFPIKESE